MQQPDPAGRVAAPAIGLMVAGGLSALTVLLWMGAWALGGAAAVSDPEIRDALPAVGVLLGLGAVKLVLDLLTVYAGWQMRQLRSRSLGMAGSVIAMLPCFCCILGLPLGIWALIVLMDDEVKQRFDGGYTPPPSGGYGDPGGYTPPPSGYSPPPGGYNPPPPGGYSPPSQGGYNPPPPSGSGGPERG